MKNIYVLIFAILITAQSAVADQAAITKLRAVELSGSQSREIDALYSAGHAGGVGSTSPVLISTPVAPANQFAPGLNVVPTTAAANTAAFIGAAVPVPGQKFRIYNSSASTVRAKAAAGATINGAVANGYIAIAAKSGLECETTSAGNQICWLPVFPTPAGP